MPRKSKELRRNQAFGLAAAYTEANLADDYRARFIRDMVSRFDRNKGLSKRQREWLDTLIEEGVPAPKGDPVLLARIEAAQAVKGVTSRDIQILGEFAGKIRRDWKLSEKQIAWMNRVIENAERIAVVGPWEPTAEQVIRLEACVKLAKGYSQMHWGNNPGTYKALLAVDFWLEGGGVIEEWHVNKLLKAMKGKLKELFEKPYVTPEKPCWACPIGLGKRVWGLATVMGSPRVSDTGEIIYPVLLGTGALVELNTTRLAKRNPR